MGTRAGSARAPRLHAVGPDDAAFRARLAEVLAERDDAILAAYVDDDAGVPYDGCATSSRRRRGSALVHPVFFGSAITGRGRRRADGRHRRAAAGAGGDADGPVVGPVFKIERGAERREDRLRPDVLRDDPHARPAALRPRAARAR